MQVSIRRSLIVASLLIFVNSCGYNRIQQQEEAVFKAWGDVETNLQRRADLVPNLVEVVKGYAGHERETLQSVVSARAEAGKVQISARDLSSPEVMKQVSDAQGELSSALSRLLVVVERYPDLKANQNFMDLQNQLEGTENRLNVARQRYNEAVERFNSLIRQLPYSLTNSLLLHLDRKEYFKAAAGAGQVPQIKF